MSEQHKDNTAAQTQTAKRPSFPPETRRAVAIVAAYLLSAALFSQFFVSILIGLIALTLYQVVYKRNPKVIVCLISVIICSFLVNYFGAKIIRVQLARTHTLNVDHRMLPHSNPDINGDGIRCLHEADDFTADTFNIIFLGDSFTFGEKLKDGRDGFVYQVEKMAAEKKPSVPIRTINFGWTSSSPLLSARLLKDIGAKYKPDLVILLLDMTDFHDDLRYLYGANAIGLAPLDYIAVNVGAYHLIVEARERWQFSTFLNRLTGSEVIVPVDRFFITSQPIGQSLPYLEQTEKNIRDINAYCHETLECDFILVSFPRSYQYSDRECPDNWEKHSYTVLGPYVEEPFKWFEALKARVNFPCCSLLDEFKRTDRFPLSFKDDPHWNPEGNRFVAECMMDILADQGCLK